MLKRMSIGLWLVLFSFFVAAGCGDQPAQKAPAPSDGAGVKTENVSGKGNPARPAPPALPPIPPLNK